MPEANDTPRTWKSTLLGVAVVCQFAAVLIANVAGFVAPTPDPTTGVLPAKPTGPLTALQFVSDRYVEATGQFQGWGMFESGYMWNSVCWDVRIELEPGRVVRAQGVAKVPQDIAALNLPAHHSRRFVFESGLLGIDLVLPNTIEQYELPTDQLDGFVEDVRINNDSYRRFLHAVYHRERRSHNDWPDAPASMELAILRFPIGNPLTGEGIESQVRYVCRWRPAKASATMLPIEAYDRRVNGVYRQFPVTTP